MRNEELQNRAADPGDDVEIGGHHRLIDADRHNEGDMGRTRKVLNKSRQCVSDHTPRTRNRTPPFRGGRCLLLWRVTCDLISLAISLAYNGYQSVYGSWWQS